MKMKDMKRVYLVKRHLDGERMFVTINYDTCVARWYSGAEAWDNDTTDCVEDDSSWDNYGAHSGMLEGITEEWVDQFFNEYEIIDVREF